MQELQLQKTYIPLQKIRKGLSVLFMLPYSGFIFVFCHIKCNWICTNYNENVLMTFSYYGLLVAFKDDFVH